MESGRVHAHLFGRKGAGAFLAPVLLLAVQAPALSQTPQRTACVNEILCSDPRGCPDLVVDPNILAESVYLENRNFRESDCSVIEGEVLSGRRRLIRFSTEIVNLGPGSLRIGDPFAHPEWFELQTCHGHPHLEDYADYRLWTVDGYAQWQALKGANSRSCSVDLLAAHPEVASQLVGRRKQGFCVVDTGLPLIPCPYPPDQPVDNHCSNQGLDVCWADQYWAQLDGQWIDVTGLAAGSYILEVEANSTRLIEEADYANNAVAIPVRVGRGRR
jgi:hypothetical protein